MAELEIISKQSMENIEFLIKEVIRLNLQIEELENNNNKKDDKNQLSPILTELSKKEINWDTLPVILF